MNRDNKLLIKGFSLLAILLLLPVIRIFSQPLDLHPDNPHYLRYKAKPVLLITSAEHYGSVLNKDFNSVTYLTTMQSEGMNYTRIFTGSYVEIPGSFGISNNTLAPSVGNFLAPWNRVDEIQNEPWADDPQKAMRLLKTHDPGKLNWANWAETASEASLEWQKEIAATIVETEKGLPKKHMIAQNYVNFKHSLEEVDPYVSILNFHYAWPEAVWMNYAWNRPINFDESGFAGSSDTTYLRQAWQFMLAGGAIFNSLDYSFFVGSVL